MRSFEKRSGDPIVGNLVDGRYQVTSVIARGGMATVYRAQDTRLDRVVALKVMHRSFAEDPGFVARFEREARAAAKLNHPHLVGVFDQGAEDGLVWLAMDYVPGHPLREVIRAHAPLDPDRALGVVEQILSGLVAAHGAGFVHRDIKPENVLMTPEGTMKITDFGLARAMMDDDAGSATKGVLIGTVAYLAPEQVETGHADARTDIYAAGVVLYELLTGSVPFHGPTPLAVAYQHVHDDVPAPSATIAGIPADVDALVLTATARNPNDRFPSAMAFLQATQAVVVDEPADALARGGSPAVGVEDQLGDGHAGPTASHGGFSEDSDPPDDWARIAAVTGGPRVISDLAQQEPTDAAHTSVLRSEPRTGPNAVPTSAIGRGPVGEQPLTSVISPTVALSGATTLQPGVGSDQPSTQTRREATPLTPVTRRPPRDDNDTATPGGDLPSTSRLGRTKLVVFLVMLIVLMAAGGWWLGTRHNAGDQAGGPESVSASAAPASFESRGATYALRRQ